MPITTNDPGAWFDKYMNEFIKRTGRLESTGQIPYSPAEALTFPNRPDRSVLVTPSTNPLIDLLLRSIDENNRR